MASLMQFSWRFWKLPKYVCVGDFANCLFIFCCKGKTVQYHIYIWHWPERKKFLSLNIDLVLIMISFQTINQGPLKLLFDFFLDKRLGPVIWTHIIPTLQIISIFSHKKAVYSVSVIKLFPKWGSHFPGVPRWCQTTDKSEILNEILIKAMKIFVMRLNLNWSRF